jgi:hypothetical protein
MIEYNSSTCTKYVKETRRNFKLEENNHLPVSVGVKGEPRMLELLVFFDPSEFFAAQLPSLQSLKQFWRLVNWSS